MIQELKAYDLVDIQDYRGEVYLKSEADKVIAELEEKLKVQTSIAEEGWKESSTYHTSYAEAVKELYDKNKEIEELKKQVHDYAQGLYVMQARAEKELRRHKYKRCFKMAQWCKQMMIFNSKHGTAKKWYLFKKWRKRWLELAEKFKETDK